MINTLAPDFTDIPGRRIAQFPYKPSGDVRNTAETVAVSVLTPYYNTEDFFLETFVSLQLQSLQNWEWVIVDDGSTDADSVDRLNTLVATDPRIRVLRKANAGPSAARNTAFKNSTGRYVCLLDSDDMVEPTYLEKCAWFLDSNPEFSFCNSYTVVFGEQEYLWRTGFERGKAHLEANSGPPISLIRRSAYTDCGGFDESIRFGHEDWDFWLAMAKAGHWGYTIQEFLQWYRKRGDGRFAQIMNSGDVNAEFEKLIQRKYSGLDCHFPEPSLHTPQAYETLETRALVLNPLAPNMTGRRVMFVIPWMVTGGADRVNLDLVEGLVARGNDVTVCATLKTDHRWEHEFSRLTPDIFVLPSFLCPSDFPRFLAYLIQSRQIDTVIITGSTIGYQLLPYLRAVAPGVAFIDMSHVEELHWLNGGHPRFGVGYQDALDMNIVTTGHLAEWMVGRGAERERIKVMYTGVRSAQIGSVVDLRMQLRAELGISSGTPVIVFAGRICEQKRPFLLAEILKKTNENGLPFRALIIGDGEQRQELEALIVKYKLTANVDILGSVPHQRWLDILVASDILLMPSMYEGISIALMEAMAAGVVPLVAKVGGQAEIVSDDAGILVAHGVDELQRYVDGLERLLSGSGELTRMSTRCRELGLAKLSWDTMVSNFIVLIDEAHRFRMTYPRVAVSPRLGVELAALALEYKRLGEVGDWLWSVRQNEQGKDVLVNGSADAQVIAKFAIVFSQTWVGRKIIRSKALKTVAKMILKRMGALSAK